MTSHLKAYLDYYKSLETPGYAVLVTGAWGVGKTYQVRECLSGDQHYYVSLFGLKATEEVHAAVIAAMAPNLEKVRKGVREIGRVSEKLGGWFSIGGSASALINAVLRKQIIPDRTLVFDDLERCQLEIKESMGVINTYLDQHDFRVVVIAHDEKLVEEFDQSKEKIFGQTIKAEPEVERAFGYFLSNITSPEVSEFINSYRDLVLQVFLDSGESSLRLLRHLFDDLTRLHGALETEHLASPGPVKELLGLFCALNIEVRAGNLKPDDLKDRFNARVGHELRRHSKKNEEVQRPPFLQAADKHPSIDLESQVLTDAILTAALIDGRYDKNEIRGSINNSLSFSDPGDVPPWKTVINFDELEDNVVEAASERMRQQFEKREITDSGEMLHVFSLRMMMSQRGIIKDRLEDVRDQCLSYIDDLLNSGRLPARGLHWLWYDGFERAHDGYGYWVTKETEPYFRELWQKLVAAREIALERNFPEVTNELLRLMATDGRLFFEQVCHTNNGENPYELVPVLAAIPPLEFVETWMGSHYSNWRSISLALEGRLQTHRLQSELSEEVPWAVEVLRILEKKRHEADGFRSLRIERTIPNSLRQAAEMAENDEDEEENR